MTGKQLFRKCLEHVNHILMFLASRQVLIQCGFIVLSALELKIACVSEPNSQAGSRSFPSARLGSLQAFLIRMQQLSLGFLTKRIVAF